MTSHRALVELGARWLVRRGHRIVLLEPSTWRTDEHPDVIGWTPHAMSTLIECKTSREDFRRERHKPRRRRGRPGMGDCRYYLAPEGVIDARDLPEGYGLLHPGPRGSVRVVVEAVCRPADPQGLREELTLALMQLERSLRGVHTHALPLGPWEEKPKVPPVRWRSGWSRGQARLVDRHGRELAVACDSGDWSAYTRKGESVGHGGVMGTPDERTGMLAQAKQWAVEALLKARVLRKAPPEEGA